MQNLFTAADLPTLRREIPLSVLLDLMTKMQSMGEEESPDAVKAKLEKDNFIFSVFYC